MCPCIHAQAPARTRAPLLPTFIKQVKAIRMPKRALFRGILQSSWLPETYCCMYNTCWRSPGSIKLHCMHSKRGCQSRGCGGRNPPPHLWVKGNIKLHCMHCTWLIFSTCIGAGTTSMGKGNYQAALHALHMADIQYLHRSRHSKRGFQSRGCEGLRAGGAGGAGPRPIYE